MHNRHLNERLADCHDWTEFDSSDVNTKILNGAADMDTYSTTEFPGVEGKLFEGLTLRLFDPKTRLWSLYWIASNTGRIDPPVVGSFDKNGVGHFFGKDMLNGKPILVVFRWDARNKNRPWWGQAFSPDNGKKEVQCLSLHCSGIKPVPYRTQESISVLSRSPCPLRWFGMLTAEVAE